MRGSLRGARLVAAGALALAVLCVGATSGVASSAAAAAPTSVPRSAHADSTCSGVHLSTFAFHPGTVTEGSSTTLVSTVRNCTSATFRGTLQTSGVLVCLVLDPLDRTVTVKPRRGETLDESLVAPSCTGTATMHGRLSTRSGHTIAARTATLQVVAG